MLERDRKGWDRKELMEKVTELPTKRVPLKERLEADRRRTIRMQRNQKEV